MKYLKIEQKSNKINIKEDSFLARLLFKIISLFTPKANPDYEKKINDVKYWLIEFDEDNIPIREIGLNENEIIILKMPYKENYGYWTDSSMVYKDFVCSFYTKEITQEYFTKKWEKFK